jgi:hypothetical protein
MNEKKPLKDQVYEWLSQQGYPLEMRVAKALRKVGFEVRQSHYYVDPQTGEHREIDILATRTDDIGFVEIAFLVECKTTTKPWILLTCEDTLSNYNTLFAFSISSKKAKEALIEDKVDLFSLPSFKKSGRAAYGATVGFTSGLDTTYKAAMSATKAAQSRKNDLKNERACDFPYQFAFPVVVVDGPIFECFLDNEEIAVQELFDSNLFYANFHCEDPSTCIRIVSSQKLEQFAIEAANIVESLLKALKPRLNKDWERMRNQPLEPIR